MPEESDLSHLSIKIESAPASEEVTAHLTDAVIDHSLHLPSMFTLRLHNPNMKWLDDETFREGKKIEIDAGNPPVKLLSGKIAALEAELDQASPALIVRGYDLSHKLYRGKQRRSFNNVTDSDLATRLAQESGLRPGQIDSTPGAPHEYVYQNNQTNAEFLLDRARRLGFEFFVEDDTLNFRKPTPAGSPVRLAWGETLRNFRARLSTAEQVNEVEVRGWDPDKKTKVEGRANNGVGAPQIGISQTGADVARATWGEAKIAIVNKFVRSPSEAETVAQAALDELASSFVEAEGVCDGNPAVLPGKKVDIQGIGNRFNGQYYVTQVIHEWNKTSGMYTRFIISGRRDHNILSIIENSPVTNNIPGVVIGLVSNNQDPLELGRVRMKFPWLSDNDESAWAPMATPMSGNGRGFMYLPEIDDEVLVAFEHGDIDRPYVVGCLWNGMDKPPLSPGEALGSGGMVNKRIIKSRAGHIILLDDTPGAEQITIVDKTGSNKIVMKSPDNSLEIKVTGNLNIEALGSVKISGVAGVEVSTDTNMKIKGTGGTTIEGTGMLTMKNGAGAQIAMTGPSVNVNNGALEVI